MKSGGTNDLKKTLQDVIRPLKETIEVVKSKVTSIEAGQGVTSLKITAIQEHLSVVNEKVEHVQEHLSVVNEKVEHVLEYAEDVEEERDKNEKRIKKIEQKLNLAPH